MSGASFVSLVQFCSGQIPKHYGVKIKGTDLISCPCSAFEICSRLLGCLITNVHAVI